MRTGTSGKPTVGGDEVELASVAAPAGSPRALLRHADPLGEPGERGHVHLELARLVRDERGVASVVREPQVHFLERTAEQRLALAPRRGHREEVPGGLVALAVNEGGAVGRVVLYLLERAIRQERARLAGREIAPLQPRRPPARLRVDEAAVGHQQPGGLGADVGGDAGLAAARDLERPDVEVAGA